MATVASGLAASLAITASTFPLLDRNVGARAPEMDDQFDADVKLAKRVGTCRLRDQLFDTGPSAENRQQLPEWAAGPPMIALLIHQARGRVLG